MCAELSLITDDGDPAVRTPPTGLACPEPANHGACWAQASRCVVDGRAVPRLGRFWRAGLDRLARSAADQLRLESDEEGFQALVELGRPVEAGQFGGQAAQVRKLLGWEATTPPPASGSHAYSPMTTE